MPKLTLTDITGGYASPATVNANNTATETAMENTLSRDGSSPNAMGAQLDMNSYKIINLGAPTTASDAARKADVDAVVAAGLPDQTGQSGKFLSTNGSTASWVTDGSTAAIAAHEAAGDPHPVYLTDASAAATYQPLDSDLTTLAANITTAGHNMAAAASTSAQWDLIKASSIQAIVIAASDETSTLTSGTAKATFRMPFAFTLTGIRASLTTAQTGGSLMTVDVNEDGASILSTKITIDNNERTSTTAVTAPVLSDTSLADDAEITIDIDTVGSGTPTGLKVALIGYKT